MHEGVLYLPDPSPSPPVIQTTTPIKMGYFRSGRTGRRVIPPKYARKLTSTSTYGKDLFLSMTRNLWVHSWSEESLKKKRKEKQNTYWCRNVKQLFSYISCSLEFKATFPLNPRFQTCQQMTKHTASGCNSAGHTVKLLSNMAVGQRKRSQVKLPHRHSKLDPHFPVVIISLPDPACLSVCLLLPMPDMHTYRHEQNSSASKGNMKKRMPASFQHLGRKFFDTLISALSGELQASALQPMQKCHEVDTFSDRRQECLIKTQCIGDLVYALV